MGAAHMVPPSSRLELWAEWCAMELQHHAPDGVEPYPWAKDRARHLAGWVSPESTVPDVVACLSRGTLRTGETVSGLRVTRDAVKAVMRCAGVEGV
jgi:hypothetical protein